MKDRYGNDLSTASAAARDAYVRGVDSLMAATPGTDKAFAEAVAADEGFALALACKDLGLSVDLARSVGVSVELSGLVEQVFRRAKNQYGDRAGEMAPFQLYEDQVGGPLRTVASEAVAR